jgi:mannan endo-1,4-beta-mannosidase
VTRSALATLATPFAAAMLVGGVLVATHHTTIPALTTSAASSGPSQAAPSQTAPSPAVGPAPCERAGLREPFAGIAINPNITRHVQAFQRATGAHIQLVEFYNPFTSPFRRWEAQQATALGALPLIQLNPRNISLKRIAAGQYDQRIRQYADAVRAFRCRVALSFGHEMNGWWYTWGLPWTKPSTFIAAWRHIHDIFASEHASNVIWSWDPSHLYQHYAHKSASLASEWYPGDAYVDWIGLDGYLRTGTTFGGIFGRQLRNIRSMTSKPVYIAETGVASGPGQAAQITGLFAAARKFRLTGLVWFDLDGKKPWRLEGRPAGLAAYRKAVAAFR